MLIKDFYNEKINEDKDFETFFTDYVFAFCFDNMVISTALSHPNEVFLAEQVCEVLGDFAKGKANTLEAAYKIGIIESHPYIVSGLFTPLVVLYDATNYITVDGTIDLNNMVEDRLLFTNNLSIKKAYKYNQWALHILDCFSNYTRFTFRIVR